MANLPQSPQMSFAEAIKTCFNKYATFSGRARRSEYWYFELFYYICVLAACAIMPIGEVAGGEAGLALGSIVACIVMLGLFLPTLAVCVRRMHDTGHSGWNVLWGLIPYVGWIIPFVLVLKDSDPDENEYGPSPKYQVSEEETTIEQ